jgi:hypothetical protein
MSESPLESETTGDGTTTFEHFDREWTVPTRRHLSHIKAMRDGVRDGVGTWDLLIAETFLTAEQFDDLLVIDPTEQQLDEFTTKVSQALGMGSSGNSKPSSAS